MNNLFFKNLFIEWKFYLLYLKFVILDSKWVKFRYIIEFYLFVMFI